MSITFNGQALAPGVSPEELLEDLQLNVRRGRMRRDCWHLPLDRALAKLGHDPAYPPSLWAQVPWYGPLEEFLHPEAPQAAVSDILFNGPFDAPFFVVRDGAMLDTNLRAHPTWVLWAQRQLLLRSWRLPATPDARWDGQRAQGVADGRLRYQLTADGYSRGGPSLSVRILPERWRTLEDLIQTRVITREAADVMLAALQAGATVLVAGATGSGKTTLTAAFTQEIGRGRRIVFVEDGGELPRTANSLHLEASAEPGGVSFSLAIRDSLRQRPDYTVVGEVRGGEAMALLQAAATGHPGIGTIHASDVQAALSNLERMAMLGLAAEAGGGGQAAAAIARGLITSSAVSLNIIHIGRAPGGRRAVLEIAEVARQGGGATGDRFTTGVLFSYDPHQDTLVRRGNVGQAWGHGRY